MRRIAWLTDLHLNYIPPKLSSAFLESVNELPVDAIFLGGDTSEAARLLFDLSEMSARVRKPVYFVLGSQDYYRSSIGAVREQIAQLCERMPNLVFLTQSGVIELSSQTALVGHDGWGDGILGRIEEAVPMNDELQIEELTTFDRHTLFARMRELGEEAAAHIQRTLGEAAAGYENICLLTHVPPFREACWHEGNIAPEGILARAVSSAMGEVIQKVMTAHPGVQLTVLCGHTHSSGFAQVLPNVQVWTGASQYGQPRVQRLFWVP
ncbi:MAG TPA: metallophosphoesterase [Bryobacteraceae bacterium]|nr:metallophosphoesterase [Bryobacteraceae bacterium]